MTLNQFEQTEWYSIANACERYAQMSEREGNGKTAERYHDLAIRAKWNGFTENEREEEVEVSPDTLRARLAEAEERAEKMEQLRDDWINYAADQAEAAREMLERAEKAEERVRALARADAAEARVAALEEEQRKLDAIVEAWREIGVSMNETTIYTNTVSTDAVDGSEREGTFIEKGEWERFNAAVAAFHAALRAALEPSS